MYQDLKQIFWWPKMKKEIVQYVASCLICQKTKIEHQRPAGMLQPLDIPEWKRDNITMDFVVGLPQTIQIFDSVWVIVDRLTKSAHFLPINIRYSLEKLIGIIRLHGVSSSIISDRDPRFTSKFWGSLHQALGTKIHLSFAYHPQMAGQSESYADKRRRRLEFLEGACVLESHPNYGNR